ncbi:MAG: CCA tRNA nucleotidyltransferase [Terracidiphilus sp.]|jgi:tRNA nucleotidyltransferase/poly(A) polymerase
MPDYIYLLENRLSADQQSALRHLRDVAREAGTILFLTGDAVRDLTSGHAVRELEVTVHGNALKLKKQLEKLGGTVWGDDEASRTLYLCFPGTVRVDLVSAYRAEYPKPGKPVFHPATIQEYLRCRDFTANAMAISLNEGSFGLLMDPLNGAADIESRTLRLVSNYGFLEEPSLLIRATRYIARLGWEMEPKTRARCESAKEADVIEHLSAQARSRELEQIGHEEEGLKILAALEAEGWMKVLFPAWTPAKAEEEKLTALHALAIELLTQGVHPDMSAAQMRLLTAKLGPKELTALKKLMLRPGFVEEWNSLDTLAAGFAKKLLSKENATPSVCFKLFMSYDPEAILWLGFTSKDTVVKERFNLFLKVWPEVRQRIPHALMQEMRITPELPAYREIVEALFLEMIDGKLGTPEETRAFLEPHSPPAPPPQVTIKRPRAKRGSEAKLKEHSFDEEEESEEESLEGDEDLDDIGGEDDELDLGLKLPKADIDLEMTEDSESIAVDDEDEEEDEEEESVPAVASAKRAPKGTAKPQEAAKPEKAAKPAPTPKTGNEAKQAPKPVPSLKAASTTVKPHAPAVISKSQPATAKAATAGAKKPAPKPVPAAKTPAKAAAKAQPAKAHPVKASTTAPVKASAKAAVKASVQKPGVAKKKPVPAASAKKAKAPNPSAKKSSSKPAKKR